MAKLEKASPPGCALAGRNVSLGEDVGVYGTPCYVIGKEMVGGAVGFDDTAEKDRHRPLRRG